MLRSLLSLVSISIFAIFVVAQDASTGAIRGTIIGPTGSSLSAANIVFVNSATGIRYSTNSDIEGRYSFELLPVGDYSGRAEFAGMSPQLSPSLHVEVGAALQINFVLQVAGAKETVTVSGAPPLVETEPAAISALLDERAIGDLPLNGRRFTDLALLAPGVTQDPRGLTSSSNGDLAFGGIRGYQSSYLIDGADNNNGFFAQARGRYRAPYQFSNEVVQEFRVSSNTYGAELGRSGGAVVNVVTKSGSNHTHGSAFYYLRDGRTAATHPFVRKRYPDKQDQFGFTVGGPIKRNKIFYFAGFDQHIFHIPTVVQFNNGATQVTPTANDYEATDKPLVASAADKLSLLGGEFRSALLGNTAFFKTDIAINPHHYLSAKLNISRYYG